MKRKIIRLGIFLALPFAVLGGCLSLEALKLSAARPPKNLKTIQDFQTWKGSSMIGQGTYQNGETSYVVMLAPAGRTLPSGPSAYLFDEKGQFVDWTSDMGDVSTVRHHFNLSAGAVKNIERKKH